MSNQQAMIEMIRRTSGQANILTIPRVYIDLTGEIIYALFLSQCIYWSDKGKDGWFYKSDEEWEKEICLSSYQSRKCRNALKQYIETDLRKANGVPTIHYRVNLEAVSEAILATFSNGLSRNFTIQSEETSQSLTETTSRNYTQKKNNDDDVENRKPQTETSNQLGDSDIKESNQPPKIDEQVEPEKEVNDVGKIMRLYEKNIGAIVPMMAANVTQAALEYPAEWIEDAFKIAVERNARNWKYVSAILDNWQRNGRDYKPGGNGSQPGQARKYSSKPAQVERGEITVNGDGTLYV